MVLHEIPCHDILQTTNKNAVSRMEFQPFYPHRANTQLFLVVAEKFSSISLLRPKNKDKTNLENKITTNSSKYSLVT